MKYIKILGTSKYIPKNKVNNTYFLDKFNMKENYILNVSGIKNRWYAKEESIEEMAYRAACNAIKNANIKNEKIDLIIIATSSTNKIMPGISFLLQKKLNITNCMCLDVLGGCNGFINAFDIAHNYIALDKIETALIVGVDKLSNIVDENDLGTTVLLGDGAGAIIITKSLNKKMYVSKIESKGQENGLLTYEYNNKLKMEGTKIYKYAVTEVPKIIEKTLNMANTNLEEIDYIILHQSNQRIMDSIIKRLKGDKNKFITNIENIGNTFCASIPIALSDLNLKEGDKIMLVGYGGGLNTGCIILEY